MLITTNDGTPILDVLSAYFRKEANYQETVAKLHILGARRDIIANLPQGTLDLEEGKYAM